MNFLQYELLPRPPEERADDNPWPTWPNIYRVSSAHEEGGVRDYSILTKHLSGEDGLLKKLHAVRVETTFEDGRKALIIANAAYVSLNNNNISTRIIYD